MSIKKIKFGDLFEYENKSRIKAGDGLAEGEYPFYTSSSVLSKFLDVYTFDKTSLIFGTGGIASIHYCERPFSVSTDCLVVFAKDETICFPKFVFYYLFGNINLLEEGFKGAGLKHISKGFINDLEIPLPPLPIQKRIAEILEAADALKRKNQALLKKYDELAQAIFIDMFGDPVKNEKGWEVKRLGEVTTIRRGASPRPINKFIGNDVPWIKIGDGTKGGNIYIETTKVKITTAGSEKSVLLKPGSLIFANCGVSLGFARILKISGCIHDGWLSIEDIDDKTLNKIFLLKYINFLTDFFRKTAPEGTQPNLNSGIMKEHKIILPPIKLQNKFSDLIFAMEESKRKNIAIEKCCENLFQTLIQKAFNGELEAI